MVGKKRPSIPNGSQPSLLGAIRLPQLGSLTYTRVHWLMIESSEESKRNLNQIKMGEVRLNVVKEYRPYLRSVATILSTRPPTHSPLKLYSQAQLSSSYLTEGALRLSVAKEVGRPYNTHVITYSQALLSSSILKLHSLYFECELYEWRAKRGASRVHS